MQILTPTEFAEALEQYISLRLRESNTSPEYIREAVHIIDAHNCIFESIASHETSEVDRIYALRDLLRVDPDTLDMVINSRRLYAIATELL